MSLRIVVAIGGNSLIKDKEHQSVEDQYGAICDTSSQIAQICRDNRVLITHGNGPQVGFILQRSDIAFDKAHMHRVPLVSCDADTQGAIGYQIQQALGNEFRKAGWKKNVVTLVTQIEVDEDDPAFSKPAKPIGSFYTPQEAEMIRQTNLDWQLMEDAGRGFRRVVASPIPRRIVELDAIKTLYEQDFILVAAGGGGIPVIYRDGQYRGVDAVIDKDRATSLLASQLEADVLIISTAVSHAALNYGKENQTALGKVSRKDMEEYLSQGHFAAGSMKPKIEAALEFLNRGGKKAIITDPAHIVDALEDRTGTRIYQEEI
jgi:carbamate kinase